jgi:predicted ABC-type ATPase
MIGFGELNTVSLGKISANRQRFNANRTRRIPLGGLGPIYIDRMPNVVILAGPNGAGKTSAAPVILRDRLRVAEFVNADVIARGLSGFSADAAAVDAGRIMLRRLDDLAKAKIDFAFETTLSGTTFLRSIDRWRVDGYVVRIVYLWLSSAETAIARVRHRVRQGGHSVPEDVILRRYERSVRDFATRYDGIEIVDSTGWLSFESVVGCVSRIREVLMASHPAIPNDHIARCFADPAIIKRALDVSAARVIRRHRLLNEPLVSAREGEVVYLDPHTVPMPEGVTEEEMGPVFDYL